MIPGSDYVPAHQEKLMENPVAYIALLRKQNVLHCVWHLELQAEIAKLKAENRNLRHAAADGIDVN